MAHRLLLTLLALLTGLVAQVGPADARGVSLASVQVATAVECRVAKAPRAPVGLARLPEAGLSSARRYALSAAATPCAVLTPAVRIGIDRARQ